MRIRLPCRGVATIRVQFLHFSNLKIPKAALLRKDLVDNSNVVIEELAPRRHELQSATPESNVLVIY